MVSVPTHSPCWFVHFAFGLLLFFPLKEVLGRLVLPRQGVWCSILAVSMILALSTLYELIEWAAAVVLDPDAGIAFLGSQGDVFDGQKDTGLALVGSLVGVSFSSLIQKARRLCA